MKFITVIALLAFSLPSYAAESSHPNFREGWDSFRFGLGIADTDNYSEQQIVIVHRNRNGADLIIDRYGKPLIRKSINEAQLEKLITDIQRLFVGFSYSNKVDPDKPLIQSLTRLPGGSSKARSLSASSSRNFACAAESFLE